MPKCMLSQALESPQCVNLLSHLPLNVHGIATNKPKPRKLEVTHETTPGNCSSRFQAQRPTSLSVPCRGVQYDPKCP